MGFVCLFLYFAVVDNAIILFNCFFRNFRNFRGFHDFRVFDLGGFHNFIIWVKVFKNGLSKICGRQPLKSFTWSVLEYLEYPHVFLLTMSQATKSIG